jgi:hypothetical protein
VIAPTNPVVGSSNPVSAAPPIVRPDTKPCAVTLFSNLEFADYNTKSYTYTPPKDCPGPWAKVVFTADFTVTAGRQYDRTAQFYLGGANIFFGTTAEPRSVLSPSWHVENDVTDLSALLGTSQAGTAILGNFVGVYDGVTYDGIIYANAQLLFYPASRSEKAPVVPDVVIGIPGNSGAGTLNTTASQITQSVTLPTNVEAAYLDVISESQSGDEFWYLCVPDSLSSELQSCGSTGYRETEISIDGIPAGVAPIYPWIYTGGIDPYLWEPIPGVQTLNFKPFRVDLTPFAGVLSNGKAHTVGISVFNANSYFSSTGNLLVYTDKASSKVTGEIVSNTLAASPTPSILNKIATDSSGNVTGYVTVASERKYSIEGRTHTSHGEVTTRVDGLIDFKNTQNFTINSTAYKQDLVQSTEGAITTTTTANGRTHINGQAISYPFTFNYDELVASDGSISVNNISNQKYETVVSPYKPSAEDTDGHHGFPFPYVVSTSDEVASQDVLNYDAGGNYVGHSGHSSENFTQIDTEGDCYSRTIQSSGLVVTSYKDGAACKAIGKSHK